MTRAHTRLARTIDRVIERLALDLSGLVVYTEAATGPFALTAPLAARAGADRVFAIAKPWGGLGAAAVAAETAALADALMLGPRIQIRTERRLDDFAAADIVTNLGFVRPIDRAAVDALKPTAVVAFMREAWEVRQDEIDLAACAARGIPVLATDEHHPDVAVFDDCGLLAAKLLFEAGIEISGSNIVIASGDPFGPVLAGCLDHLGAGITLVERAGDAAWWAAAADADAIVIADFVEARWFVGPGGLVAASELAERAPGAVVIAFAGGVEAQALERAGVACVPASGSAPRRMGRTLAHLGPGPVALLHGAGLKVGAAAARARLRGLAGPALLESVRAAAPAAAMEC